MARVSERIPVTFDAAENDPIRSRRSEVSSSARSRRARSMRPSASSPIVTTSAMDSRHGSSLLWCSYGPMKTSGRSSSGMCERRRVAVVEVVGDAQVEDVDELVDRRGHARSAEDHRVIGRAADGVADDPPRLLAEAAGLEPRPRRLRVRVRVERQDRVAQVVLDERQRAAGGRVVRVGHPPDAERAGHRLVVADDRVADEVDQGVGVRHRGIVVACAAGHPIDRVPSWRCASRPGTSTR